MGPGKRGQKRPCIEQEWDVEYLHIFCDLNGPHGG